MAAQADMPATCWFVVGPIAGLAALKRGNIRVLLGLPRNAQLGPARGHQCLHVTQIMSAHWAIYMGVASLGRHWPGKIFLSSGSRCPLVGANLVSCLSPASIPWKCVN